MITPRKIASKTRAVRARVPAPIRQEHVFEALLPALKPAVPPVAMRARVLARIAHDAEADALQGRAIVTVPASNEGWADLAPKVRGKRVYTDGVAESWLIRLQAGAHAPSHDHPAAEECLVLEGSIRYLEGSTLHAGDYEMVRPGAHHSELVSDTGALLFLRYAQPLANYITL